MTISNLPGLKVLVENKTRGCGTVDLYKGISYVLLSLHEFSKAEKSFLKENFGVIHIGLFGSYAKNRQTIDSDIDFLVEFEEPRFDWIAGLNIYLEKKLDRKIGIVRKRALRTSKFFQRIEQEVIYV